MRFELIGKITNIKAMAVGNSIRDIARLRRMYGAGRWRKLKGRARVRLPDGSLCAAELHWDEAHGIGRSELKIKTLLED
jgi:hypothetical protein